MKKIIILLIALFIALSIFALLMPKKANTPNVVINNKLFLIDVAKTDSQKEKGLSIYNKLPINKGMIFIFSTYEYYAFWMKDMKFPIDIIYIKDNSVVDVFENLPNPKANEYPVIVKPSQKVNYVLEINANLSRKYNIKRGDTIKINL